MNPAAWFDFSDRVAVVTGGAGAIGAEVARGLAGCGARVIVADVDGQAADSVASGLEGATGRAVDLTDGGAVRTMVSDVIADHGAIDVLVNVAAIYVRVPAIELAEADFDRTMAINVKGTWLATQAVGAHMIDNGYGRIVNYTSNAGIRGSSLQLAYNASKAAVISMTKSLAIEWSQTGVTVNAVAPGPTDTPLMTPAFDIPGTIEAFEQRIPIGRLTPVDVTVGPVLFLASPMADSITGHTLFADGGMSAM